MVPKLNHAIEAGMLMKLVKKYRTFFQQTLCFVKSNTCGCKAITFNQWTLKKFGSHLNSSVNIIRTKINTVISLLTKCFYRSEN